MKLIALLIAGSCLSQLNFERFFGHDYAMANAEMASVSKQIELVSNKYLVDDEMVKAIVFPELIRNSVFSGMMEEKTLALSYIELGSDKIDFSIGKFQIKPSFASEIETLVSENANLKRNYPTLSIAAKNKKAERAQRIKRLSDVTWQTTYVCAFIAYCEYKYSLNGISTAEKIKFLATAYNAGLKPNKQEVEANYDLRAFPYGKKFKIRQVNYWEVSLDYFIKNGHEGKIEKQNW